MPIKIKKILNLQYMSTKLYKPDEATSHDLKGIEIRVSHIRLERWLKFFVFYSF
jgi:hypothetical protein